MSRILYLVLLGLGIIFVYIKYIENKGIYFPTNKIEFYPSSLGLPFEDIYIKTEDDIKINGWFIPYNNAKYTLLFFHGNAGNIGHRIQKLHMFWKLGVNLFIVDYRGYGQSEGRVSEKGFYLDAKAAYDYLVNSRGILPKQIILYGESLGIAVVVDLASLVEVKALILEGAFSRGKDIAKKIYPFLPTFLFSNQFDSLEKIKKVKAQKLFIHSRDDEVIPYELARKLYNAADEPKEFIELVGGHNDAFWVSEKKYISSINSFLERLY